MNANPLCDVDELVDLAFEATGEKHRWLAGLAYPWLLGPSWKLAFLGFAYVKLVDHLVDRVPDGRRAAELARAEREWLDDVYAERAAIPAGDTPRRFGYPPLASDAAMQRILLPSIEAVLRSIEQDARRRNQLVSRAELDRWAFEMGGATLRYLGCFASPGRALPDAFVRAASLAYLLADCAIDVEEDLAVGILRVSREDVRKHQLSLKAGEPGLDAWAREQGERAFAEFARALALARSLPWRMRGLAELVLRRKRRDLSRTLARLDCAGSDTPQ